MAGRAAALLRVALSAALAGLAAWSFRPAFDGTAGFPLLQAVVAPVLVALGWGVLAALLGRRLLTGTATAVAVLLVAGSVAVVTRAGADARLGPHRLLTGVLPVGPSGPELAAVAALAGLAALVAVRLAVTSRSAWWPVVPALCPLLLGLGLSAAAGPLPAWYPSAFVATGLALVLAGRATPDLGGLGKGRLAMGAVVALAAGAAGFALTPLAAGDRAPASLQSLSGAPVVPKEETNPLARYLALRDNLVVFELTGTASERPERIAMVTLTEFDGQSWRIGADYRRAGTQLPAAPTTSAPTREVTLDVQVSTPASLGWLPRVGWPGRISVPDLGFDAATGDVVVPAGRETPTAYRITGSEPIPGPDDLLADDPATADDSVPLPPELIAFAGTATAGRSAGLGKFQGLYDTFRNTGFSYDLSAEAPGGHGLRQISKLLRDRRGTSEQYASAFAVLARHLGWDARVVLGFRPTWDGDRFRISGQNVHAWVEVRFQRLGWLPFDPSPSRTLDDQGRSAEQSKAPEAIDQVPPPDAAVPQEPGDDPAPSATTPPASGAPIGPLAVLAAVGGVLALYLIAVPVTRTVRRARARRTGTARRRVLAAWQDAVNALRDTGFPVSDRSTTGQVVETAGVGLAPLVRGLADLVDHAAYAADGPTDPAPAWRHADTLRAQLRATLPFRRRLLTLFNPTPLLPVRKARTYRTT